MNKAFKSVSSWAGMTALTLTVSGSVSRAQRILGERSTTEILTKLLDFQGSSVCLSVCLSKRVWCSSSWLSTPDSLASTSQAPGLLACTTIPFLYNLLNIWAEMYYLVTRSHRHKQICVVGAASRAGSEGSRGFPLVSSGLVFVSLCVLFASPG